MHLEYEMNASQKIGHKWSIKYMEKKRMENIIIIFERVQHAILLFSNVWHAINIPYSTKSMRDHKEWCAVNVFAGIIFNFVRGKNLHTEDWNASTAEQFSPS